MLIKTCHAECMSFSYLNVMVFLSFYWFGSVSVSNWTMTCFLPLCGQGLLFLFYGEGKQLVFTFHFTVCAILCIFIVSCGDQTGPVYFTNTSFVGARVTVKRKGKASVMWGVTHVYIQNVFSVIYSIPEWAWAELRVRTKYIVTSVVSAIIFIFCSLYHPLVSVFTTLYHYSLHLQFSATFVSDSVTTD